MNYFNLTDYCLTKQSKLCPDKAAFIFVDETSIIKQVSYSEFYQNVASCAKQLRLLKVSTDSKMLIHSVKNYEFFVIYFAAIAANITVIAALKDLTSVDIELIAEQSQPEFLYQSKALGACHDLGQSLIQLSEAHVNQWSQDAVLSIEFDSQAKEPAFIIFTSGSSGMPKGVIHSHDVVLGREIIRRHWLGMTNQDSVLVSGQPCWTYSMGVGNFDSLAAGATSIVYVGEDQNRWYDLISRYKVSLFVSSPKYLKALINQPHQDYDLSSLRQVISAGEALPIKVIDHWYENIKVPIFEALGMTELSTFISSGPNVPLKKGFIGRVQPGRLVRIVPIDGGTDAVSYDQIGLLAVHKDCLGFMLGYLQPENNAQANYREQWFVTADCVSQDEEGYIRYHGRYDNLLNVNGRLISPLEIEQAIIDHADINDVVCGLLESEASENILTAWIVSSTKLNSADMIDFLSAKIAHFKIPQKWIQLKQLPRGKNGKIDRKKIANFK